MRNRHRIEELEAELAREREIALAESKREDDLETVLRAKIAELERDLGLELGRRKECYRLYANREAQLAEMRGEVQMMRDREPLEGAWSWVLDLLDRFAIPTTPPEAEGVPPEPKTRRPIDVTLSPREASPPPPAVDPREEEDA